MRRVPYIRKVKGQTIPTSGPVPEGLWAIPGVGIMAVDASGNTMVIHAKTWLPNRGNHERDRTLPWMGMFPIEIVHRKS